VQRIASEAAELGVSEIFVTGGELQNPKFGNRSRARPRGRPRNRKS